jgi:hypothetical protein
MFIDRVAKIHLESGNVFTARGDARPPLLGVDHA